MNSLENNAAEAIRSYLATDATLGAIPPSVWDDTTEAAVPCLVIKCTQGEELVYRHGVYRVAVEIMAEALAEADKVDDYKARVCRMLLDDLVAHTHLVTAHFHCFATEAGGSSIQNSGPNRVMVVRLSLVGFDLDRHTP
jgi:hypothetical protein